MNSLAIDNIRFELEAEGIDCLVLFSSDPHLSENALSEYDYRSYFLDFKSSAGVVVITRKSVFLRVDSRYHLAAEKQFKNSDEVIVVKEGNEGVLNLNDWLLDRFKEGDIIAVNYQGISSEKFLSLKLLLKKQGIFLTDFNVKLEANIEDEDSLKLTKIDNGHLDILKKHFSNDLLIVSSLDTIAWLSGYRYFGENYDPIFYSYLIFEKGEVLIFTDFIFTDEKSNLKFNKIYGSNKIKVNVKPYSDFYDYILNYNDKDISLNVEETNEYLFSKLKVKNKIIDIAGKLRDFQIIKSEKEIKEIKQAMEEDNIALSKFQEYLKNLPSGTTEYDLGLKIMEFHSQSKYYKNESFHPIVGFNKNGAIVHYQAKESGSAVVEGDGFLLVDSGAHYSCGTTDITRIFPIGNPKKSWIKDYYKVLECHKVLSEAVFKEGTTGKELDDMVRAKAKELGVEFGHGTGHGVGFVNCVHEKGVGVSPSSDTCVFKEGMVVSCEPGYYKKGHYGIRIENVLVCRKSDNPGYLCFEDLTAFPILEL